MTVEYDPKTKQNPGLTPKISWIRSLTCCCVQPKLLRLTTNLSGAAAVEWEAKGVLCKQEGGLTPWPSSENNNYIDRWLPSWKKTKKDRESSLRRNHVTIIEQNQKWRRIQHFMRSRGGTWCIMMHSSRIAHWFFKLNTGCSLLYFWAQKPVLGLQLFMPHLLIQFLKNATDLTVQAVKRMVYGGFTSPLHSTLYTTGFNGTHKIYPW